MALDSIAHTIFFKTLCLSRILSFDFIFRKLLSVLTKFCPSKKSFRLLHKNFCLLSQNFSPLPKNFAPFVKSFAFIQKSLALLFCAFRIVVHYSALLFAFFATSLYYFAVFEKDFHLHQANSEPFPKNFWIF